MADVKIGNKTVSQEEVEKALALLANQKQQRAKQRERMANNPEAKAKLAASYQRNRVKNQLLLSKAVAAGIKVTEAELDAAVAAVKKAEKK